MKPLRTMMRFATFAMLLLGLCMIVIVPTVVARWGWEMAAHIGLAYGLLSLTCGFLYLGWVVTGLEKRIGARK